ncbi:MAG: DUF2326 domain-containing protein [Candidatus Cryptobacteroides sp.]|nr:DUF2326 domain-containing protein [Candidatus Cryptobacteroides sp.]
MYLSKLTISSPGKVIRDIEFHKGLNLIVDETPENTTGTGNNVGKTTVLRLIDYCLGGDVDGIYRNPEDKHESYALVKDFLIGNNVIVTLILVDDLDTPSKKVVIERDFKTGRSSLIRINGKNVTRKDFVAELESAIFPEVKTQTPSFRQIIAHNIRIDNLRLENTLKTLTMGKNEEYEALYLFMFGCPNDSAARKTQLAQELDTEKKYKRRMEHNRSKNEYKAALSVIESNIEKLVERKDNLNINENLQLDINSLNALRAQINKVTSRTSLLSLRRELINETVESFDKQNFGEDVVQLEMIYKQASAYVPKMQRTFKELVDFHNTMLENKKAFVVQELPSIQKEIESLSVELERLKEKETVMAEKVLKSDTYEELEVIIVQLSELSRRKGEFESYISQIESAEKAIKEKCEEMKKIDDGLFTADFAQRLETQRDKFNKIFSEVSLEIYDEQYIISYEVDTQKGKQLYKFHITDVANFSSGKKQGEISCFDIAYTVFADQESIPCLHFILNDKKELVHGNQLNKFAEAVNKYNVQFVCSMLYDKLPPVLRKDEHVVVRLSQDSKLFRIEELAQSE